MSRQKRISGLIPVVTAAAVWLLCIGVGDQLTAYAPELEAVIGSNTPVTFTLP